MRAIEPRAAGTLTTRGFTVGWEEFGDPQAPPILLLPTWQIIHSRAWKMQVPFLARSFRVIAFDTPGNGLGERTTDPAAFEYERIVRQATDVLDHLAIQRAAVISFSRGCDYGILLAATEPERVERLILIGNGVTIAGWQPRPDFGFWDRRATYEGWQKRNAHYFQEHYDDWLAFFFPQVNPEPHSTKLIEDQIGWAHDTTPEILVQTIPNPDLLPRMSVAEAVERIRGPVLLIHGDDDHCDPLEASLDLVAARPDWELVVLEGCGHGAPGRHPVKVNELIREFLNQRPPTGQQARGLHARA